jgi:hypothetical protein
VHWAAYGKYYEGTVVRERNKRRPFFSSTAIATVSGPIFVSAHFAYFQEERAVVARMRLKRMTLDQTTIHP